MKLKLPESSELINLSRLLQELEYELRCVNYDVSLGYKIKMGCLFDCTAIPDIRRYSYNLYIQVNGHTFVTIQYELDRRFSLEISQKEVERMDNMLAKKAIMILSLFGVRHLIDARYSFDKIKTYHIRESEDRKRLSLN